MNEAIAFGAVTLGMLDGSTKTGSLMRFSPRLTELALDCSGGPQLIAAEQIAFIAVHRPPTERLNALGPGATAYKIHVTGHRSFAVEMRVPDGPTPIGFMAYPRELDGPYKQLFFYRHGVAAREKDEPIGEMLVSAGVVRPEQLADAIERQRDGRTTPIGQILVELRKVTLDDVERAAATQARRKLRIGEVLVEAGLVTTADIDLALAEQRRRKGKRLGEVLVEMKLVSEEMLTRTLARKFDLPFVDLDACALDDAVAATMPRELIAKLGILPIGADENGIVVANSDPLAFDATDVLRFHTKRRVDEVLVMPSQLARAIADYLQRTEASAEASMSRAELGQILEQLASGGADVDDDAAATSANENDSAIVNLVNKIILDALRAGASDIHIEPNGRERPTLVRFRVDGECAAYEEIPAPHRASVVARVKIMARLDISERRKPQDGKIRFKMADRNLELRVATIPTSSGDEDVVMRILAGSKPLPLTALRLSERNLTELTRLIARPYGLVLCVGPTGSGKTTTLHSALGAINTTDTKIWTAEDPVEITQPGLRQVQVNPKIGFTFAHAMRSFLRADPDVIMIGEMRDEETASTAVEASLTGHLVLSTLHTNSAPETITRLLDMGLDPFSFGDALLGVLAQRLARALCACKTRRRATSEEWDLFAATYGDGFAEDNAVTPETFEVWTKQGCTACGGTGYKGRVALHELLVSSDALPHAIARRAPVEEIRRLARTQGMKTLAQDGVAKSLAGLTDLAQVLAVCSR